MFWMLYAFFWAILRSPNFICQRFRTLCLFHLHRQVDMKNNWGWECWGIYRGKAIFEPNPFPFKYPNIPNPSYSSYLPAYEKWNRQSVPKCWHIKFSFQGITQKNAYSNAFVCSLHLFLRMIVITDGSWGGLVCIDLLQAGCLEFEPHGGKRFSHLHIHTDHSIPTTMGTSALCWG